MLVPLRRRPAAAGAVRLAAAALARTPRWTSACSATRAFSAAAAALGLNFFALLGATFYLVFYLQGVRGYTPLQSGAALIPVAARHGDSWRRAAPGWPSGSAPRRSCATGFLLIALSFVGIQLLGLTSPVWLLLVVLSVQGLGMGAVMAPATESIMSVVPREKAGAGAAVNNSVRQVGGALGVAILGSVLAASYAAHLGSRGRRAAGRGPRARPSQSIVATLAGGPAGRRPAGTTTPPAPPPPSSTPPARRSSRPCTSPPCSPRGAALVAAVVVLVWLPGRRRDTGGPVTD